jgi:hypothetical protein
MFWIFIFITTPIIVFAPIFILAPTIIIAPIILFAPILTHLFIEYFYSIKIKKIPTIIKIIYDGNQIETYEINDFLQLKNYITLNYDYILYEIPFDGNEHYDTYVLRYETINDVYLIEYNSMKIIDLTDMHVIVNETEKYSINFGRSQYMLPGNVLFDRKFMKWYLNMYCHTTLHETDTYKYTFRDHKMKFITLPDYCYLLLKKNNYTIVNYILN